MCRTSNCLFPNEPNELMKQFQVSLKRPLGPSETWVDFVEQGFTELLLWNGSKWKYRLLLLLVTPKLLIVLKGLHLEYFASNISYQLFFFFLFFWDLHLWLLTFCGSLPFVFNRTLCPLRGHKLWGPCVGIFIHQSCVRIDFHKPNFAYAYFWQLSSNKALNDSIVSSTARTGLAIFK